ncbi:unnamed protein product [Leuciscus chuanchicus]
MVINQQTHTHTHTHQQSAVTTQYQTAHTQTCGPVKVDSGLGPVGHVHQYSALVYRGQKGRRPIMDLLIRINEQGLPSHKSEHSCNQRVAARLGCQLDLVLLNQQDFKPGSRRYIWKSHPRAEQLNPFHHVGCIAVGPMCAYRGFQARLKYFMNTGPHRLQAFTLETHQHKMQDRHMRL